MPKDGLMQSLLMPFGIYKDYPVKTCDTIRYNENGSTKEMEETAAFHELYQEACNIR